MDRKLLNQIADFVKYEYKTDTKRPDEDGDVFVARCYMQALIRAVAKEGKDVVIINRTDGTSAMLGTAVSKDVRG